MKYRVKLEICGYIAKGSLKIKNIEDDIRKILLILNRFDFIKIEYIILSELEKIKDVGIYYSQKERR